MMTAETSMARGQVSRSFEFSRCLLAVALGFVASGPVLAGRPEGQARREAPPLYAEDEVLVVASADVNGNQVIEANENLQGLDAAIPGSIVRRIGIGKSRQVLRVKLPKGKSVKAAIAENWRKKDSRIVAVEPNYSVSIFATPNDPRYSELWGLNNTGQTGGTPGADIDAPQAWDTTTGSSSVVVAVIDTGVDNAHADLTDNMWRNPGETGGGRETNGIDDDGNGYIDDVYGWDCVEEDNDPGDPHGHGTHVAGTIAARGNNGVGVTGVNWQCRIMACRFLDAGGYGWTSDAIEAVYYAVNNGARILSNSWGGGGYSSALEAAIENARQHGVLFVAAAGNWGVDADVYPMYPAAYTNTNIISVASTDHTDSLSWFSNYGLISVDLGAPGESILSTIPAYTDLFVEDFQGAGLPGFGGTQMTVEGPASRWGTVQTDTGFIGNRAARSDWASTWPYQGGSDGSMITPALDTRGLRGLSVEFSYRYQIGGSDRLSVDVWNGSEWYTLFARNNSSSFGSDYFTTRLGLEAYRNAAMKVRFRWTTDTYDNNYYGAEIDNVRIQYSSDASSYAWYSGTSMATPHVSGAAALLLADNPNMNLNELKARLVFTGTALPALAGRTVSGRRLNVYNALHAPPGLAVNSPNGGERWPLGSLRGISWSSIAGGSTVTVELLKGGAVLRTLASGIPNTGDLAWTIDPALPVGTDYRIRINDGINIDQSDGDFEIFEFNDLCTAAICLADRILFEGSTVGSTGTDISSCAWYDSYDVWHSYTPATSGNVEITTAGSAFDTTLSVYTDCDGQELACNDDYGDLTSRILMPMIAGATYKIRVSGYWGQTGPYRIVVNGGGGGCGTLLPVYNLTQNRYYATIQAAIDQSNDGDEIVVSPGTYTGPGNRDIDFSHGLEQEGQSRRIMVRSTAPSDPAVVASTIINCQGTSAEPHRAFIFESAEGPDSIVDGFTITGGYAPGGSSSAAGGAIIINGCYPTIRRCVFTANQSVYWGGAVAVFGGGPTIHACSFISNTAAESGGGLYLMNTVPAVSNCRFLDNTAVAGGGVYIIGVEDDITPVLVNCVFDGNQTSYRGGALRNNLHASPLVANCTFVHNSSVDTGGIHNSPEAAPTISNCIFRLNSDSGGTDESAQINIGTGAPVIRYCCIQGWTTSAGTGNFGADPLLVDIDGPDNNAATWSDNDLHLQPTSPCVNAGDPAGSYTGQTDVDGESRLQQSRVDIGADESPYYSDCAASSRTWRNTPFAAQSGTFTVGFDATPQADNMDGLIGLSAAAGSTYSDYAVLVGFNSSGRLQARNGGSYMAYSVIPYTAGQTFHFRMVVNVVLKRYSAYVSSGGGAEQTLAVDYAFRTEQSGVTSVANWGIEADNNTHTVCAFALQPVLNVTQNHRYATIQAAIDDAASGDVIELSPMIYTGIGNRDVDYRGKPVTVRSTNPDDPAVVAATVIDCQATEAEPHRGFKFVTGEGSGAILAGVTIRNGVSPKEDFNGNQWPAGGGIFARNSSPTIRNSIVTECQARALSSVMSHNAMGGGVYSDGGGITIEYCTIRNNKAISKGEGTSSGGGVECSGTASIRHCRLTQNIVTCSLALGSAVGGGAYCSGSAMVEDCTIDQNLCDSGYLYGGSGGGISVSGSTTVRGCRIINNLTGPSNMGYSGGAGIYFSWDNHIERCLITANRAGDIGGGIKGSGTIHNCMIVGNAADGIPGISIPSGGGAALFGYNFPSAIYDSVIAGNSGGTRGGGLLLGDATVEACTLFRNSALEAEGGTHVHYGTASVRNTIVWGNLAPIDAQMSSAVAATYSCIQDWTGGGQGNITADPQFAGGPAGIWTAAAVFDSESCTSTLTCSAAAWAADELAGKQINPDGTQHLQFVIVSNTSQTMTVWGDASTIVQAGDSFQVYDYHIRSTSACLNAGDPAGTYTGRTDIDGEARVQEMRIDMGADEAASLSGCLTGSAAWLNTSFPGRTGVFSVEFDARANANNMDGIVALSAGAAAGYPDCAVLVGFNNSGQIMARDYDTFRADTVIAYTSGQMFHFRLLVDMSVHRYSVFVTPPSGSEQTLAGNYRFRDGQQGLTSLANWGIKADSGTHTVCGFAVQPVHNSTQNRWYPTIDAAVLAATGGDEIVLSLGVHAGDGNRDVSLLGKAITLRSVDPEDPAVVAGTIIDCQGSPTSRHRGLVLSTHEGPDTVISGLTITNGYAPESGGQAIGSAIYCDAVAATITHCVLANNSGATWGGGLGILGGKGSQHVSVRNCTFRQNAATDVGGGMYVLNASPQVANCSFFANTALAGGGLYVQSFDGTHHPEVVNCVFDANSATAFGGAVRNNERAAPTLRNCTVVNNSAPTAGGISVASNATPTVINCLLWANSDGSGTGEPAQLSVGSGTPTVQYSCIQGISSFSGNHNLGDDPVLVDVDGEDNNPATWADNNRHVLGNSPCVDAGDPAGVYTGQTDMDGQWRVQRGLVDIGADEWIPGDFDSNGQVNLVDADHFAACALGPMIAQADPACRDANLDRDAAGDVDMIDFAIFQKCWTGTAAAVISDCAD